MALSYTWWIIFSESSRERFFDSPSKSWNFRPPMSLWSQTRKRRSASRNLALIYWWSCWQILRQCNRWEHRFENTYHGVVWARHNTESRRELFAVFICFSTHTRNGFFSNCVRRQTISSSIQASRRADTNLLGTYSTGRPSFYRTRDQLPMKVLQTGKKQKDSNSNHGRMRQKFGSWKFSFRGEVVSGSTHLGLVSDWLPEFDVDVGMEDLDIQNLSSTSIR